jgi:hypothetical protein
MPQQCDASIDEEEASMADTNSELEKLKALIASDPDLLKGAAGAGDVKNAAKALAQLAASKGIALTSDEIETAFAGRSEDASPTAEPLDDEALDQVSGGGSPYCIFTKGCYCIFTK